MNLGRTPGWLRRLKTLGASDTPIVWKLNGLGRSLRDLKRGGKFKTKLGVQSRLNPAPLKFVPLTYLQIEGKKTSNSCGNMKLVKDTPLLIERDRTWDRTMQEVRRRFDQPYHFLGLLTKSFRPQSEIITLRRNLRHRETLVQEAGTCIQRTQKAPTEMNVQLANVISDISGMTGLRILQAMVGGERDPHKLAKLRDRRIKASEEEVANGLYGNWREELIFILEENLGFMLCSKKRSGVATCGSSNTCKRCRPRWTLRRRRCRRRVRGSVPMGMLLPSTCEANYIG